MIRNRKQPSLETRQAIYSRFLEMGTPATFDEVMQRGNPMLDEDDCDPRNPNCGGVSVVWAAIFEGVDGVRPHLGAPPPGQFKNDLRRINPTLGGSAAKKLAKAIASFNDDGQHEVVRNLIRSRVLGLSRRQVERPSASVLALSVRTQPHDSMLQKAA